MGAVMNPAGMNEAGKILNDIAGYENALTLCAADPAQELGYAVIAPPCPDIDYDKQGRGPEWQHSLPYED